MAEKQPLHITSGDVAGASLEKAGLPGEVFVWHDILYDGPRSGPGWIDDATLEARVDFLSDVSGGGMPRDSIRETLRTQYAKLAEAAENGRPIVLWFDACLFDQSMLAHILGCLQDRCAKHVELLVVDRFPGIEPYHGLGQMTPQQLASVYDDRSAVTNEQYAFAKRVDAAFATQNMAELEAVAMMADAPLPWAPTAVRRWLDEQPHPETGLGRLESFVLQAVLTGLEQPTEIYKAVAAADTPPQYWGDTTLWAKINGLAAQSPPVLLVKGPTNRLPQWDAADSIDQFRVTTASGSE